MPDTVRRITILRRLHGRKRYAGSDAVVKPHREYAVEKLAGNKLKGKDAV
jgi:hypothetical protein